MHEAHDAWEDIVIQAYQEGNSLSAIAREAGTNHVQIGNILERRGVRTRKRTLSAALAEVEELRRRLAEYEK